MTVKTLLLVTAMAAAASARQPRDNSPLFTTEQCQVRTLNSEGHAAMLADSSAVWLVDYYAPWCPHCRQFAPAWEKAAAFYADKANVNIAAVDCTQNSEVCNREGIMGYPTIKLYHVPPESTEPVKMAPKNRKNTNTVIAWVEEQMEEHGMKTSAGTEDIDAHIEKINNGCEMGTATKTAAAPKDAEHVLNDQNMEMKFKRLHDAGIAAVSTFENGFYVGTTVLEGERYEAAVAWVEALAKSFPMAGNRAALEKLADAIKKQSKWEQGEWNTLLTEWKKNAMETSFPVNLFESSEKKNWAYCTTYTCGVWTLFHTLSASVVASDAALKPSEVMAAIRLFVKYFFSCEECQRHFMMANPESLLEKLAESDAEGPRAVAIWIWKMHNKVNKVLKYSQWPSLENCPKCYVNDGEPLDLNPARLHEDEILAYVTSVFGHKDTDLFFLDAASNGVWTAAVSIMQRYSSVTLVAVTVVLTLPFMLRSKKSPKTEKTD
ncbi:Sulfhydryl oxidase 1 [Phytophthora pseudosyringae]|uniref:Sulfhydryl oxidase 1 n=1 Tax=Phytophthora pseudosyringae TaxID=221518 RepID=A0A8T1WHE6_9STRA|nr:Sulfhydryl oxidase 1 [Phytophthora pseudosyringae]